MQNIVFSKKIRTEANSFGVSVSELVMADLITLGYTKMDAFFVAFPDYQTKSPLQAKNVMDSVVKEDKFKLLVKQRAKEKNGTHGNETSDELMSKQTAAREIMNVAQSLPVGSKERGEMFVKYVEMLRKNDESVDAGNDHISYYLPLTCSKCTLYKDFEAKRKEKEETEKAQISNRVIQEDETD